VQIIFVDRRFAKAHTLDVSRRTLALAIAGLTAAVLLAVVGLYAVTLRAAAELRVPFVNDVIALAMRDEMARNEQFVRDNVTAMAKKLGEMQAQLMRLDALGERVAKLAGIRPQEFNFKELPGIGGAAATTPRQMSMEELQNELQRISRGVEHRADYMDVIESELMETQVRHALLPQNTPVSEGFVGSKYGMRADPFTGHLAMHAGVDFAAPAGTPIYAAAGGVVAAAEKHAMFGNMVEIDHGNDLSTLYAHASRLNVKVGDIVKRGQKIAEVGSTGRSTGPHLHFEVHVKGAPQNPAKFLLAQRPNSPLASLVTASAKPATRAKVAKRDVTARPAEATRSAAAEPAAVAPAATAPAAPSPADSGVAPAPAEVAAPAAKAGADAGS
jgi:murein DD-endopeptidase MepM/ murein hydrolase activator NlpD